MVQVVNSDLNEEVTQEREKFHHEEVSIEDLSLAESANDEFCEEDSDKDLIVPESELEKICILLRGQEEGIEMEIPRDKPKCKFCKSHKKFHKWEIQEKREKERKDEENSDVEHYVPPKVFGKNKYLYYVDSKDCIKDEVKCKYGFQLVQQVMEKMGDNPKKKTRSQERYKS